MDESKLENFYKAYPDRVFPGFTALTAAECERLRKKVATTLGLSEECGPLELVQHLQAQTGSHLGEVPGKGQLDLRALLEGIAVGRPHRVFLNWYRFDDIDSLDLDDLSRHFDDIWYPSVDDIEVFDESCRWFLVVSHDGRVGLIQR